MRGKANALQCCDLVNAGDSKNLLVIKQEVRFFQRHSRLFLGFVSLMNEWPEAIRECTIVILQGRTSQLSKLCMPMHHDVGFNKLFGKIIKIIQPDTHLGSSRFVMGQSLLLL